MTDPFNINFDDLGICLLGNRIKFGCLYIQQKHYGACTMQK